MPKENLIGKPGGGFFMLEHVMTWEILCIFIMMVGEMQRRLEQCIDFAKKRTQFGAPIGLEPVHRRARSSTRRSASRPPASTSTTPRERFARKRSVVTEIAIAKLVTSEANLASALSAVQIFGGRGYMREAGLEKELRAAVGAPIYSGTNEMQRIRIAVDARAPGAPANPKGW